MSDPHIIVNQNPLTGEYIARVVNVPGFENGLGFRNVCEQPAVDWARAAALRAIEANNYGVKRYEI